MFIIAVGSTALVGWFTGSPALIQLLPHLPPMTRNAALCFMLCGVALWILARGGPRWTVVACACVVGLLAALTLCQIFLRLDIGIDELLGSSYIAVKLVRPGRMAPVTAACFLMAAIGLGLAPRTLSKLSALWLGIDGSIIAALGLAATVGFWGGVMLAALHTAVSLSVLGIGLLALAWHVDDDPVGTPPWLPASAAIGVVAITMGLWRAVVAGGHSPFALLPSIVLGGGCLMAPVLGLTVYLAQRAHTQAAALRRSGEFLTEAQRLSRTGSFSWRVSTDTVTYSEQTYRTHGFDSTLPVTLDLIATRVHPDDLPLLREMVRLARGPGSDLDQEYRLLMPDLTVKYLHLVARATRDPEGQREYVGAIQDITQRWLAEEALGKVRSELAHVARVTSLGVLTASIAHEVSQPLAGIVTNASTCLRMLAAEPPNVEGAMETARRTIRDGNRASDVIAGLRTLFVKRAATTESVDLNEAAREVIALSRSELQRGRVVLRVELAGDLPSVAGDRVQLQQVILNLLLNASDAMHEVDDRPRQLTIQTAHGEGADGGGVCLAVRDAGVGLDPRTMERLFEAFYTTKSWGMGIGLSVSRSIVESHRGRLWAAANDGPGATFSFSIPREAQVLAGNLDAALATPMPAD
ncbi:ATP-binding protein [Variovorax sp. J31P207]|uniref:sensor histidine kinase n=1 Tax=Variovorax sp. J31P207 TaxID=3053510 RepID=UPI0025769490|nr:ATP-binding protein [Variovorax sp. J31P207]MDM0065070.1 ATP-binding protein [Variovorax sp. J31P207]